jgi:hypothetical protein
LRAEAVFNDRFPVIFTPEHPMVVYDQEAEVLKQVSLLHEKFLDQLSPNFFTHQMEADINTLIQIHADFQIHAKVHHKLTAGLIIAQGVFTIFLIYYCFLSHCQLVMTNYIRKYQRKVYYPSNIQ